jgi:hypothetical protein
VHVGITGKIPRPSVHKLCMLLTNGRFGPTHELAHHLGKVMTATTINRVDFSILLLISLKKDRSFDIVCCIVSNDIKRAVFLFTIPTAVRIEPSADPCSPIDPKPVGIVPCADPGGPSTPNP